MEKDKINSLIVDMALKSLEDMNPMWHNIHELVHIGGGTCRDAHIARVVAIETLHRAMTKRQSPEAMKEVEPLVEAATAKLEKILSEIEAENQGLDGSGPMDTLIRRIVSKVFGIPEDDIEIVEDGTINQNVDPTNRTRH
jgi:hypothetical protein